MDITHENKSQRKFRVAPFAEFRSSAVSQPGSTPSVLEEAYRCMANLAEELQKQSSTGLHALQQENEQLSTLLAQREEELEEAYAMIAHLDEAYETIHTKYKRLSAYLLKLELELRHVNRALEQQPQQLPASTGTTMDELLQPARKEYVLEQRGSVIYRVKKKGGQA
ncbi:MAG: hypothetical protein J6M20_02055 [Clostridia bacterium]|nr:hypothetical protein [Clostridia bacterium]